MEILKLIDRLETLATSGRKVPIARRRLIDSERLLQLVDQMRIALPRDIQETQETLEKRDSLLNEAMAEAKRIKTAAEAEARALLEEQILVKEAHHRAEEIAEESRRRAQLVFDQTDTEANVRRTEADGYAQDVMYKLEQEVATILATIRRGIEALEVNRGASVGER